MMLMTKKIGSTSHKGETMDIKKVAVIGSGVMGSGIAGQIANAGIDVVLLDIVPKDAKDRNVVATSAIQKMLKTKPSPFMHKRNAKKITPGNVEDHLEWLADCDWIVEVVLENLDIKRNLYEQIEQHRKDDCVVSSNTSSIPLKLLTEGRTESFTKHFMVTHFFNPPRYMRLLELVTGPETDQNAAQKIEDFCDVALGKGVVKCNDTPGFIANRIGAFWLQSGMNEAFSLGISVEEADAVMSRPVDIPKTGIFGLLDLVGIDLMPHLAKSLLSTLPDTDMYASIHQEFDLIDKMIADGYTGRKGKGGFYRLNKQGGKKVKESLDLKTGEYAASEKVVPDAVKACKDGGLRALVTHDDKPGQYAWNVLSQVLAYSSGLVPEIADDVHAIDLAMKWGYNWGKGPFELIDALGADWFADKLAEEGREVPTYLEMARGKTIYRTENGVYQYLGVDGDYHDVVTPDGVLLLEDIKRKSEPVHKNESASLWDIGDGVLCLEFTGKMNALDTSVMDMIYTAIETIGDRSGDYQTMVIYNEGQNFSVGANLQRALGMIEEGGTEKLTELVRGGQMAYKALKHAAFPVVAAPSGMALGGGCEILLHSDALQAHAETYCGLVEVGVGIIPGWGGCKEMLLRHSEKPLRGGPIPPVVSAFETIGMAKVAGSAEEARSLRFLKPADRITMNRNRLLADAKAFALELAKDYEVPDVPEIRLPGETGKLSLMMAVDGFAKAGHITPHDIVVSEALAKALTGCDRTDMTEPVTEDQLLDFEFEMFMKLVETPETVARIEHMLNTGKPLRN